MAKSESNADPHLIFAEEYGVDTYEGLVLKRPDLKGLGVEIIARRAVALAVKELSPLETAGLDRTRATRVLAAVMSERALMPFAQIPRSETSDYPPIPIDEDKERIERDRAERIYHASKDPRIVDCILSGEGEDILILRLVKDYDVTEQEARTIIDDVRYRDESGEIVDYDDET